MGNRPPQFNIRPLFCSAVVALTLTFWAAGVQAAPAMQAGAGVYQLRLIVKVPSAGGLAVAAKFGSNPALYQLAGGQAGGQWVIQAQTASSGAVIYIARGGEEVGHYAVRWQPRPGGITTVEVDYAPDQLGGLRLAEVAQTDGLAQAVGTAALVSDASPPASTGGGDGGVDGGVDGGGSVDGGVLPDATTPVPGVLGDSPTGFVAQNPPGEGIAGPSPAMPTPPAGVTATLAVTPTRTVTPQATMRPTISATITPTGGQASKQAGGGGVNPWIVTLGLLLIGAGIYGPKLLSGSGTGSGGTTSGEGG